MSVRCPLCGSCEARKHLEDGPWILLRCGACSHVHLADPPAEDELAASVYDSSYWRSEDPSARGYADYFGGEDLHLLTMRERAEMLGVGPGERLLDVGCASGCLLAAALERGAEVRGIEPSPAAAARATGRFGPGRVHCGTLRDRPDDGLRFDWIAMVDVLEHMRDPRAELRRAAGLLAPGGRIAILTQDPDSFAARVLGRRWHHYKQPEHLHHFPRRALAQLCAGLGLEVERVTRKASGKWITPAFASERLRRVAPYAAPVLRPLLAAAPARLWADPRDSYWLVARGPGRVAQEAA